ncbi:MAG: hypothetical protein DMG54_10385 [Acidobacteria bacterium]|nr:MAG: hypothetical protein DMG54_10385 [Acidobacteriota bacterium]
MIDLTLWLLTTLVEGFVVYLFLIRGLFRRFLFLNFYLLFSATANIGRYAVLYYFGFTSPEYFHFYYFSEAPLKITLFISVCELSLRLVGDQLPRWRVALWGAGAFLAIALFSLSDASSWGYRVAARPSCPTNSHDQRSRMERGGFVHYKSRERFLSRGAPSGG